MAGVAYILSDSGGAALVSAWVVLAGFAAGLVPFLALAYGHQGQWGRALAAYVQSWRGLAATHATDQGLATLWAEAMPGWP